MSRTARFVQLAATGWLGVLYFPIRQTLTSDPAPPALAIMLSAVLVFTAVYAWFWSAAFPARASRSLVAASTALTIVASAVNLAFPWDLRWGVLFGFVLVAWGFSLPARSGLVAIGVAALVALATLVAMRPALAPEQRSQFPLLLASGALQAVLLGLGAVAVNNLITTEAALRTARQELARLAVEQERLRFARDLHDLLGHSLSLIVLKSELASRLLPDRPEPALAEVRDIESVARAALGEVREAVAGYRRPTIAAEVAGARAALVAAGIECRVEDEAGPLPPGAEAVFAWAVREGATNVVRHSHARHCRIRLASGAGTASVEITDDGRGGSETDLAAGSGLLGLRERVGASGGRVEAGPLPGGGFRLRVTVLLQDAGGEPPGRDGRATAEAE